MSKPRMIENYEGNYYLFDDGRVFSVARLAITGRKSHRIRRQVPATELRPFLHNNKLAVYLYLEGKRTRHYLATLVLDHFGKELAPPVSIPYVSKFLRPDGWNGYECWHAGPLGPVDVGGETW